MSLTLLCCLLVTLLWPSSASDIEGTLRAAGVGFMPYLGREKSIDGLKLGVDFDLLQIIARKMNLKLNFTQTREWGRNINASWTGTIGKVMREEAAVGVGNIAITHDRMRAVTFSPPIYAMDFVLYTSKAKVLPQHFNMIKPFDLQLWTILFLSLFVLVIALIPFWPTKREGIRGLIAASGSILLELLATLLGQSRNLRENFRYQAFVFVCAWLMFTNLMLMAYECNLRAYLTSMDYEQDINTIEEVHQAGKSLYIPTGSFFFPLLKSSDNSVYRGMHKKIVENEWHYDTARGIPLWLDEKVVDEGATSIGMKLTWISRFNTVKTHFGHTPTRVGLHNILHYYSGFIFGKNSTLRPIISDHLMHLLDCGVVDKVLKHNANEMDYDEVGRVEEENVKLGMDHLLAGILIYVILVPAAIAIFAFEIAQKKRETTKIVVDNRRQKE